MNRPLEGSHSDMLTHHGMKWRMVHPSLAWLILYNIVEYATE